MHIPPLVTAAVAALLVACTGCTAAAPSAGSEEGTGSSQLVPSFAPGGAAKQHQRTRQPGASRRPGVSSAAPSAGRTRSAAGSSAAPAAGPSGPQPAAGTRQSAGPARSVTASTSDPSGDVRGGLGTPPPYVDLVGATLTRTSSGYELKVTGAAALPSRQGSDGRTTNIAGFFDVDGDGGVDYEVWASLADDGWGTSYRSPDGASFGSGSGVTARPAGRTLVIRFPRDHVGGAHSFRWAVGAEWGSYEQVGSGTTASDHAPDSGAVRFPG